jgi:NitT/TauT family transport system substrate-binding protein
MQPVMSLLLGVILLVTLAACGATVTPTGVAAVAPTKGASGTTTSAASAAPTTSAGGAATTGVATSTRAATSAVTPGAAATTTRASGPLRKLTIGLGYIPDIQFAPFYVAKERGYFRDEGLDVEFKQGFETDVLKLLGTGALNFGVAGGDEVIVARSQGVPLVYVASWYQKFPVTVVALKSANITKAEDLKGRTIGVPGRYGATYVGLRALLDSAGLKESDVQIREVGFNQVQALTQGQVEAVVGYTNNEPVQLKALGQDITTINVFDRVSLVSNGLITDEKTQSSEPELVRAVTRAFLRGVQDTLADPEAAITVSIPTIPGAADKRDQLRAVLTASLPLYASPQATANGVGYSDPAAWSASYDLLKRLGFLGGDLDITKTYTNQFLPKR